MPGFTRTVSAGAFLAAALLVSPPGQTAEHDDHIYAPCAKACADCARECDSCATHCANMIAQGKKEHLKTLRTCQDCATTCYAAASIVARKGPFSDTICEACADACQRCGKACERFPDDPHMKKCAEECFRCEKACREMLKHLDQSTAG